MPCQHLSEFGSSVVVRAIKDEDGIVNRWMCDIRIACTKCGIEFRFPNLPQISEKLNLEGPSTGEDGFELYIPIEPPSLIVVERSLKVVKS